MSARVEGHGPDQPCQRTSCSGPAGHPAGRHLDPRDELYDGPHPTLQILPLAVRDSARKIVQEAPALTPEVIDMAREIVRLRDQVVAVRVDRDRRERTALLRAESCEQHGKDIERLGQQITALDRSEQAAERGRMALVGLLHVIEDFVVKYRRGGFSGELTAQSLVDELDKAARKTSAAHMRAWKPPASRSSSTAVAAAPDEPAGGQR
jgi:hypothetical protein